MSESATSSSTKSYKNPRPLLSRLKSQLSIKEYHLILAMACFLTGVFGAVTTSIKADGILFGHADFVQIITVYSGSFLLFILAGIFYYSGVAITNKIELESNLLIEEIDRLIKADFSSLRLLREKDQLRPVAEKLSELRDHLKKQKA